MIKLPPIQNFRCKETKSINKFIKRFSCRISGTTYPNCLHNPLEAHNRNMSKKGQAGSFLSPTCKKEPSLPHSVVVAKHCYSQKYLASEDYWASRSEYNEAQLYSEFQAMLAIVAAKGTSGTLWVKAKRHIEENLNN